MKELAEVVRELKLAQQRSEEKSGYERENLLLRLENALLRFERRLPPGEIQTEIDWKAIQKQLEMLKHENEELRKRLEQIEQQ